MPAENQLEQLLKATESTVAGSAVSMSGLVFIATKRE